jgi:subtilisin family serine protease
MGGTFARQAQRAARYVAGELVVTYRPTAFDVAPATLASMRGASQALASRLGAWERRGELRVAGASPMIRTVRVIVTDPSRVEAIVAELRADPAVARVERNALVRGLRVTSAPRIAAAAQSNDSGYVFQAWNYRMIDAPGAWDLTTGSTSVVVAVIDDGIRFDHPELTANLTADGHDFVSDVAETDCDGATVSLAGDGSGYDTDPTLPIFYDIDETLGCISGPSDDGGHGLHVAGTIGGVGNNITGITGINWTVRIRPIRAVGTTGSGTAYDVAQAILYAAGLPADDGAGGTVSAPSRADVINLSFGTPAASSVLQDAVVQATAAGSLIVAAAGNDASSTPLYPAAYDDVLAVAAVGPDGLLASYSSFGAMVDIAAPGGDLADGGCEFGVMSTWWLFHLGAPGYECVEGTSMAASHVSGVAALLLAREPGLSAAQLRTRLTGYATDVGPAGRDDSYGAGIVNGRNALTQTPGPTRQLYVQLHDAATGTMIARVAAQPGAPYAFTGLADGTYHVFAGMDADGDQRTGVPGRAWAAFGGATSPTTITIAGAGMHAASFAIGAPTETEPNGTSSEAGTLLVGGYVRAFTSSITDADVHRIVIVTAGTYTFETSAVAGACGFALEEDTVLELLDAAGSVLAENDDVDFFGRNYCSRISASLAPGTYYVRVRGLNGLRRYDLEARSGS